MKIIMTKYGVLTNVSSFETYDNGNIKSANVSGRQKMTTDFGELIPRDLSNSDDHARGKTTGYGLSFYKNGHLKKVMLEEQTEIMTPIGKMKAELITFYEDGSLHRVFPLNGKIDGYWSEENEKENAEYHTFDFLGNKLIVLLMGIRFFQSGRIKSILMWPGEISTVISPIGEIPFRQGLSFYESGELESLEPAMPTPIETKIGAIGAYDCQAIGVHADCNSLKFNRKGEVISLMTDRSGIEVIPKSGGHSNFYQPKEIPSRLDMREIEILPLRVEFNEKEVFFCHGNTSGYLIENHTFRIRKVIQSDTSCSGGCSGCSGCNM